MFLDGSFKRAVLPAGAASISQAPLEGSDETTA
jgi:hypothetical protein